MGARRRWAGALGLLSAMSWSGAVRADSACESQCSSTGPEGICRGLSSNPDPSKLKACVAVCLQACQGCAIDPPPASVPIALNLLIPGPCATSPLKDPSSVVPTLASSLASLGFTEPDIRRGCFDIPTAPGAALRVRMWPQKTQDPCKEKAREKAPIPGPVAGLPLGIFILQDTVDGIGEAALKSVSANTHVPGLHLDSLSVRFDPAAPSVLTIVHGHDDMFTPTVDFTTTITDTLTMRTGCHPVVDPGCGCITSSDTPESLLDKIEIGAEGFLAAVLGAISPIPATPLFDIPLNDVEGYYDRPRGAGSGVGCQLWQTLPDEIALPAGSQSPVVAARPAGPAGGSPLPTPIPRKKLAISWDNAPNITDQAIVFSGTVQLADRVPAIRMVGPPKVTVYRHSDDTDATFEVRLVQPWSRDFVNMDQLVFLWSGSPGVTIDSPTRSRIHARIAQAPDMKPGDKVTRTLAVSVKDSEGSIAQARLDVTVLKSRKDPPVPTPTPPPECKVNPLLPQCKTLPR